jgi:xylulokinase
VLNAGEVAATAGTSGVVYGINETLSADSRSRVNSFVHVNSTLERPKNGVLMCLNGTGILNSWLRRLVGDLPYEQLNQLAAQAPVGAAGLSFLPFGNGAERILENRPSAASLHGVQFNIHGREHVIRAAQEGIVYALNYGMDIMRSSGVQVQRVRAGHANMFLSPVFREAFVNAGNLTLELYNTDAAQGAARGAGIGAGVYASPAEAFGGLELISTTDPTPALREQYQAAYSNWLTLLDRELKPAELLLA